MKRCIIISLLTLLFCVSCIIEPEHQHTFSYEWTYDETYHWHEPTCGHDVVGGKAVHSWDDGKVTSSPTHLSAGIMTYTCYVCRAIKTESIPALVDEHSFSEEWTSDENYHWHASSCGHDVISGKEAHKWDEGKTTKYATHSEEGVFTYTCTVCGYTKTEPIPALVNNHSFSEEWTTDDDYHWHTATCGHDLITSKEEHSFDGDVCSICGYVRTFGISADGVFRVNDKTRITGSITIPVSIDNITVTSIGDKAFKDCSLLTEIIIPDSVTRIGSSAFYGCESLSTLTIPGSVTDIGGSAFYGCIGLSQITIPDSVSSIRASLFYGCSGLSTIVLPDSITSIGSQAFFGCSNLSSVSIPASVTTIGEKAFTGCTNLSEVYVDLLNNNYSAENGILYSKGKTTLLSYPSANGNIVIPNSVTSIGDYAFYGCTGITSVLIPSSVTGIGSGAFKDCTCAVEFGSGTTTIIAGALMGASKLTSVVIPNSVTSIEGSAFKGCAGLTSITIPDSVKTIGYKAFDGCSSLTSITIPKSVTGFGYYAFDGIPGSIIFEEGTAAIKAFALYCASDVTSVVIPDTVTRICNEAFWGCENLTSIIIPEGVTNIEHGAFYYCSGITDIVLPEGITTIAYDTFGGSGLTSIVIPDGVTCIETYAFISCSNLSTITIPNSVTQFMKGVFQGCSSLSDIIFEGTEDQWNSISKGMSWKADVPTTCIVHCTDADVLI